MTIKEFTDFIGGYVYTDNSLSDCTNGGASSKNKQLYVCTEKVTETDVKEFCKENPYYKPEQFFKPDFEFLKSHNYCRLEPVINDGNWYMFGGNYLKSSDSRFKEFVNGIPYPVPIHDRTEHTDMGGN